MNKIFQYIDILLRKILEPLNSLYLRNNPRAGILIDELRQRISKITITQNKDLIHNKWLEGMIEIKKNILNKNPKNFLQWNVIRITMFIGNALFILREFFFLRQNNWNKWKKAIIEKRYVSTEPFLLYPKSSGNLIHQAYHLATFEKISGKEILDFDFIFEYGGGYGSMCQLIHNLGFKGKYILYDSSILSALQVFYLRINTLDASFNNLNRKSKIFCLDDINKIEKIIPGKGKGLFIATWSLSESPLEVRKKIYPITKLMDSHLIGYQGYFWNIDNHKFFKNIQKRFSKLKWWNQEIKHLKENFYLFGF